MRAAVKNVTSIKQDDSNTDLSIIIPAAGVGYRMKSYGPKALIEVSKNTSIIEKQIKPSGRNIQARKYLLLLVLMRKNL
jgi:UDP-N-acetylglucosamine pyrophosphorylase